ncbi:DoxX family protein [Pseudoxanthomonas sp. PXM03]|uniref:DoxX family protein n=1 Tax=Pseudoxanthomonas sp. PXM03 TaxID=2769284 RepID=UPI00178293E8|nr:DoxX family protein [Pseudoxanthomonas sp. PXM03]MBD9434779.1 DoxX family protein [Pseudoxanthomonas sp. PXM03]
MITPITSNKLVDASFYGSALALSGRLLMATIFIISGVGKVTNPGATAAFIAAAGLPLPQVALLIAIVIEIAGGIALVLGYRTRLVAGALAIFCLVTAVSFHRNFIDQNQFIHFFKNLTMAGGFLQILAYGPGFLSVDAKLAQTRGAT